MSGGQIIATGSPGQIISILKQCPNPSPSVSLPYRFYLTDTGGSSSEANYVEDYSGVGNEKILYFTASYQFDIYGFLVNISDSSKFYKSDYGGITALVNGVKFFIRFAGTAVDVPILFNDGIKYNDQWLSVDPDARITSWEGTAQTLPIHVDTKLLFGGPLTLSVGDQIKVILNDDFTGLDEQTFKITGQYFVNA